MVLLLNKLKSPLPKDALCQIWSKLAAVVLDTKILKIPLMYFIIS